MPAAVVPDTSGDGASLAQPASFVVTGELTLAPKNVSSPPRSNQPDAWVFTLRLDPGARTLLVGGATGTARVGVRTSDGVTFEAAAPLRYPVGEISPCGTMADYTKFVVTAGAGGLVGRARRVRAPSAWATSSTPTRRCSR